MRLPCWTWVPRWLHDAQMSQRGLPRLATVAGAGAAVVVIGYVVQAKTWGALLPIGLAFAWFLAGVAATRARPEHVGARLLLGVGTTHLMAFALSAVASEADLSSGLAWGLATIADVLYAAGFVFLAALLAFFPRGPRGRADGLLFGLASVLALGVVSTTALTSPRLELALPLIRADVPAPAPLPVSAHSIELGAALPLLVVLALGRLAIRTLGARDEERRQLLWPAGVGALLALLLVTTPAGTAVLGRSWALVFVPVVSVLPFALLAGLVRFRLLEVELYLTRTLAQAAVLAAVLMTYAGAAGLAAGQSHGRTVAGVAIAMTAAVTAAPLRTALSALLGRFVSGKGLPGPVLVRQLSRELETADIDVLASRTATLVATGLEASWVRVVVDGKARAVSGEPSHRAPDAAAPLAAAGETFGAIECGPRHGAWTSAEGELLELLARHAGLALHGARLTAALADRVAELEASRSRLVRSEERVRRQLERDLHDGVQQSLVVLLGRLELLRAMVDDGEPTAEVAREAQDQARRSLQELRETVRGIRPPLLADRGLVAAVESRASLMPISVCVERDPRLEVTRYDDAVEGAAYFMVCEALTNVVKHSGAAAARVVLSPLDSGGLQVIVADKGAGLGSCAEERGTGLAGLRDRVEALGGRLSLTSSPGAGTTVVAELPTTSVVHA